MLDVHPPHEAAHTWKDFFIHIATICVGLLIAIGLEQAVEHFHRRHQLQKAREELRDDIEIDRRLTALQLEFIRQMQAELQTDMGLLLVHRATERPLTARLAFDWNFRRVRASAWNTNKLAGTLELMPHPELAHYDYIFTTTDAVMDSAAVWETEIETAKAIATRSPDGALSPQDTSELNTAISKTQGELARTQRLILFAKQSLDDHSYDR